MFSRGFAVAIILAGVGLLGAGGGPNRSRVGWTNDPAKMAIPDAKVTGKVLGKDFAPTFLHYNAFLGQLILAQSSGGVHPEVEVRIGLPLGQKDALAGRKFVLDPKTTGGRRPRPSLLVSPDGTKLPQLVPMPADQIAMKLEFGEEKDGNVPGKIYLCLSDKDKGYLAGTFEVKADK